MKAIILASSNKTSDVIFYILRHWVKAANFGCKDTVTRRSYS